jgi:hypothetical protein
MQFHFHHPSEHTIDGEEFDLELHIVHKLMYVQKNQEYLFDKWRYAVTTVFFQVPQDKKLLSDHQRESMDHFDEFMYNIIQRDETKKSKNPFSKFENIVMSEEMKRKEIETL